MTTLSTAGRRGVAVTTRAAVGSVGQHNGYGDRRRSSMHVRAPRYLRL